MRYEKGHKETTRRRILETAAARFRKNGIEGVGVADLMAEAGLTHGGFYSHFTSREELVREAMNEASGRARINFDKRITEGGLERWIRYYLSTANRDHPEGGCAMAALGAELARHPAPSREGFSGNIAKVTAAVESHLPSDMDPALKKKTAVGIFATLIGALQMARTVTDLAASEQIMEAGIATAMSLAQIPTSDSTQQS
jgi:TetR/AcrR family transcriptional repressor of nem operon